MSLKVNLNIDCMVHILSKLSFRDRQQCRQVCRQWKNVSDHLTTREKQVTIVSSYYKQSYVESSRTIIWHRSYIQYTSFCKLLEQFPNLRSLTFVGLSDFCDPMIHEMATACPLLESIEFISCDGLGRNPWDDYFYNNVTEHGWQELIATYRDRVTKLVLNKCSIDDKLLDCIINGFDRLIHLDVRDNSIKGHSLQKLGHKIRVLKLGNTSLNNSSNSCVHTLLNWIVAGNGKNVVELHIQGVLSRNLSELSKLTNLDHLVINFTKPVLETDSMNNLSAITSLKYLRILEVYQYDPHDCMLSLTSAQLSLIVNGCRDLRKLVIKCDQWCDSDISDSLIKQLCQCCTKLNDLTLCPGSFLFTDSSLRLLCQLPLKLLSLTAFPAITEHAIINFIANCKTLQYLYIEDCFKIKPTFITSLHVLFKDHFANRTFRLELNDCDFTEKYYNRSPFPTNFALIINKKSVSNTEQVSNNQFPSIFRIILSIMSIISTTFVLWLIYILYKARKIALNYFSAMILALYSLLVSIFLFFHNFTNLFINFLTLCLVFIMFRCAYFTENIDYIFISN